LSKVTAKRTIVARPLWYLTRAPVSRADRVAHVTFYDGGGGTVCGASLFQWAAAVVGQRVRRCPKCVEWLSARDNEPIPAVAVRDPDLG